MEGFTPDNLFEPTDYTLWDGELATLIIQPAFVEGIVPEEKTFTSVPDAVRFIFRNNREYGVMLWNGLPLRFSYTEDLPLMIAPLTALWTQLLEDKWEGTLFYSFTTPAFNLSWQVKRGEQGNLMIRQHCSRIHGNYHESLEELGMIAITTEAFLREWKLVIAQVCEAWRRSEVQLNDAEAEKIIGRLMKLDERIVRRGVLYD